LEHLLAKDPTKAAELAASFNQGNAIRKHLAISTKLVSLAGKCPEGLADFIKLVEIPIEIVYAYGLGPWQTVTTSLPPQSGDERARHIRDAVALLAERNPALAEATVESLTGWHREQALAGLLIGRSGTDLDAAIHSLSERAESPGMKENVLQFLLTKWIEIEPRQAIAALDKLQKGKGEIRAVPSGKLSKSLMRSELLAAYAERDFEGCMTLLGEVGTKADVGDKLYQVITSQLRENPAPTLDAMEKLANRLTPGLYLNWIPYGDPALAQIIWNWCASRQSNEFVKLVASTVLMANAHADPELAIELFLRQPDLVTEFPRSSFSRVFERYTVDDAKRILGKLPEKERFGTIHSLLTSRNLEWDVSDCQSLYDSLPENSREQPAEGIAARLAESDPEAAVAWILSQPEGEIRNSSVRGLIEYDPLSASEWVDQLEPGEMRDSAAWQLADKLADQGDFESAIAWASNSSNPKSRPGLMTDILLRAAKTEPVETLEGLINQSGLSIEERKSLHEKTTSGQ
jgi:hypothetical protein